MVAGELPLAKHWLEIKGPMRRQFTALKMYWGKGRRAHSLDDRRSKTSAEGWLIAERMLTKTGDGEIKYYFSNLPQNAPPQELAAAVRARWPIEQFYEDGKQGHASYAT